MTDDFSNAPLTITELRANRSESAKDWTARDALVATLRDIDSGKLGNLGALVIVYEKLHDEGTRSIGYSVASPNSLVTLGLISRFDYEYNQTLSP